MIDNNTKFSPVAFWAKLPHPMRFHEATSVATDSNDNVYVYNRGLFPLIIFDKEGNYINHWGQGEFDRPHGIRIDENDDLFRLKGSCFSFWDNRRGERFKTPFLLTMQQLDYQIQLY